MHLALLRHCLESPDQAHALLHSWGVRDHARARHNLKQLAESVGPESLAELVPWLGRFLPRNPDPDMALNNFERFLDSPAGRAQRPVLLESRGPPLEKLLELLGTSQFLSDLLARHPEYLDMLRVPLRASPSRSELLAQLQGEVEPAYEDSAVLRAFRRFRQRQLLRIGTNDITRDRPLEEVTRDISRVADAAVEVALAAALRTVSRRFGEPLTEAGRPARC